MTKQKGNETKKVPAKGQPHEEVKKETEVDKYFSQLVASKKGQESQELAIKEIEKAEKQLKRAIRKGEVTIKEEPSNLSNIIIKQIIDEEAVKAEEMRKKREQILKAINKLDMRMKRSSSEAVSHTNKQYSHPELLHFNAKSVLSKEEHEILMEKIQAAQQSQRKRQQEMLENLQRKLEEEEIKIKQSEQQKFLTEKQLRRMRSESNIAARKEQSENNKNLLAQSRKQLLSVQKKSLLHEKFEQQFTKSVVLPSLEEKKKKLKEIREISKAFDVRKLDEEERNYLKRREKSIQDYKSMLREEEKKLNYQTPYKSQRLTKILEEQLTDKKKQLQKNVKVIEQKLIRQENYVRLLKEKHQPKIDPKLQAELSNRVEKMHTKKLEAEQDARIIGIKNLELAKKRKRAESQKALIGVADEVQEKGAAPQIRSRVNYLKVKDDSQYYSQKKKENLQKILQSQASNVEKEKMLNMQSERIEENLKRKEMLLKIASTKSVELKKDKLASQREAYEMQELKERTKKQTADLLLSGIKAKLGLIQLAE